MAACRPDPSDARPRSGTTRAPVAFVAGGSRGLGLIVARELSVRGFRTVICARDADQVDRAVRLLAGWCQEVQGYVCDVADHRAVEDLVARVGREVGDIEVSVHVAGVIQVGPLAEMTRADFEEAIGVMTWGPINLALAVLPGMQARGSGRIATVTSIGGMVSVPHLLPYSTAKFGAVGFSQGLRAELAGTGVTVTTVVPGLLRTGSPMRARFVGAPASEYAWFATGASLPGLSLDAERAACRIVDGTLAGRGIVLITPLAKVGARVAGLAPALTSTLMGLVAQVLPAPSPSSTPAVDGRQARRLLGCRLVDALAVLGTRAARRFNETSDPCSGPVDDGPAWAEDSHDASTRPLHDLRAAASGDRRPSARG